MRRHDRLEAINKIGIVLGGRFLGVICPGVQFHRGKLSGRNNVETIFLGGNCPGGNCPRWELSEG